MTKRKEERELRGRNGTDKTSDEIRKKTGVNVCVDRVWVFFFKFCLKKKKTSAKYLTVCS